MGLAGDVAANLIAAGVGAALMYLGRDHLAPIIRGRLRDLPKLDRSVWSRRLQGTRETSTMTIRQSGASIRATTDRVRPGLKRSFRYKGKLSGHQIVLTWDDLASPEQLIGAMVLHISADLQRLSGYSVYYRHKQGEVVAVPCIYDRSNLASP